MRHRIHEKALSLLDPYLAKHMPFKVHMNPRVPMAGSIVVYEFIAQTISKKHPMDTLACTGPKIPQCLVVSATKPHLQ